MAAAAAVSSSAKQPANIESRDELLNKLDDLYEEYLGLLDNYKSSRDKLAKSMAAGFMDLAKANFSNPNRVRFGQDYYDQRMQASRIIDVGFTPAGVAEFSLVRQSTAVNASTDTVEKLDNTQDGTLPNAENDSLEKKKKKINSQDPLRWFGLFASTPLKSAQNCFIDSVDGCLAQLASIDCQMKAVEVEIRRTKEKVSMAR